MSTERDAISNSLAIEPCTKQDFDFILENHAVYWDSELTLQLHHPIFVFEFGDTAFVICDRGVIAAYLFGVIAQTGPVAYVHLVAVHPDYRGRGLARRLYDHFMVVASRKGCTALKATASPMNAMSIQFHLALGMEMQGEALPASEHTPELDEVKAVRDYLRPGSDRVVFLMDIPVA